MRKNVRLSAQASAWRSSSILIVRGPARQIVFLKDKGRFTLGRGCVHGQPFSQFCVEKAEGGWGGGDNGLIQVEMGILHHLGKKG